MSRTHIRLEGALEKGYFKVIVHLHLFRSGALAHVNCREHHRCFRSHIWATVLHYYIGRTHISVIGSLQHYSIILWSLRRPLCRYPAAILFNVFCRRRTVYIRHSNFNIGTSFALLETLLDDLTVYSFLSCSQLRQGRII